jgi:hypothetical protein
MVQTNTSALIDVSPYQQSAPGAQLSGEQAAMIVESARPVWVLFDPDEAGVIGAIKAKHTLHEHGCLFVAIVELPGQPDTLSAETLRECLHL